MGGVFADFTFGDHDGDGTIFYPVELGGSEGVRLSRGNSWAIGGRVGYLVRPDTMAYFNAGYTRSEFEQMSLAGRGKLDKDLDGFFLGVGFVKQFGHGLGLSLEYRDTNFNEGRFGASSNPDCCAESFDVDAGSNAIRAGLTFHFGELHTERHVPMK